MRKVDRLPHGVPSCSVIPFVRADEFFVDPGTVVAGVDPTCFISATAVEAMADLAGRPTAEQHSRAVSEVERLLQRVAQLEAELAEAERLVSAIDVIESAEFRARKRPGRPKKEVVA